MSARRRRKRQKQLRYTRSAGLGSKRLVIGSGASLGATLAMSGVAQAAPTTFTVGSLADTAGATDCAMPSNTDCTLRQAITDANANPGADTIVFRSGLTGSIELIAAPQLITEALAVQGPGSSQIALDGGASYPTSRTFNIDLATSYDPVSISGLTLSNGFTSGSGGALYNRDADLTISNAVVTGSRAFDAGGGIASAYGDVTVTNSTISGNVAFESGYVPQTSAGGGIWISEADLTVDRSTVEGNGAVGGGGGIYSAGAEGAVTITNATITGNASFSYAVTGAGQGGGGGVSVAGSGPGDTLTVIGSTVTNNTAAIGGGLNAHLSANNAVVQNSIVTGNTATGDADTSDLHEDYAGFYFDTAFSLIGRPAAYVHESVPGSNLFAVNPQLGGLANNGGPTQTQLPAHTSPVIDKGMASGLNTDQRGLTRPIEIASIPNSTAAGADGADMGAVEVQSIPAQAPAPAPATKKKCKKKWKKHKRADQSAKKKKCKKKKKK
jgi:hypothetical protein